jgi:hypothetical protein
MALDALNTTEVIEVMENFLNEKRPPENIRDKLDLSYRIENLSIFIYKIRPAWDNPNEFRHYDMAKTTYVKNKNIWKVYWMRGNLKWSAYKPPTVKTLKGFIDLVIEDEYGCFWD